MHGEPPDSVPKCATEEGAADVRRGGGEEKEKKNNGSFDIEKGRLVHGSEYLQDKRLWPVKWRLTANAGVLDVEALNERRC